MIKIRVIKWRKIDKKITLNLKNGENSENEQKMMKNE